MAWWAYLISPIARYLAAAFVVVMLLSAVYVKISSDAVREASAQSTIDALERTQNAIAAGDSVDVSPERVLEDDGNRRD